MKNATPEKKSRFYKLTVRLTSLVLLFLFTLVLLEVCLRLVIPILPEPQKSILEEATRIPYSNTRSYYGSLISLPPTQKATTVVIGDSFPFGTYVKQEDTFPNVLAELNNEKVINLGTGSQSPPEYNRMMEIAVRYEPEKIIYCIFANDFIGDGFQYVNWSLSAENTFAEHPMDTFLFKKGLSSVDKSYMTRKKLSNLLLSFQLFKLFQQPIQKGAYTQITWSDRDLYFHFVTKEFWDPGLNYDKEEVKDAVLQVASLVRNAAEFSRNIETEFYVVLLPSKEMVYAPIVDAETRSQILRDSYLETYRALYNELDSYGIPCYDLTEDLQIEAQQFKKLYFSIDGHFNEAGHRLSANLINKFISSQPSKTKKVHVNESTSEY